MKIAKTFGFLALGLATLLIMNGSARAGDSIRIGISLPLTGPAAADGADGKVATMNAINEINDTGGLLGKKVEVLFYDDRVDPKEAIAVSHKMIQQDRVIAGVGGSYSAPTRVQAPVFQEAGIPYLAAYATHPDVTKPGIYCFRLGILVDVEARAAGIVALDNLKGKRISMLTADNDYGRSLSVAFRLFIEKSGKAKILSEQIFPFQEKDFKAYLANIKREAPDLVLASGYYFQYGPILKQAKEMGLETQFLGEEGGDSPKIIEIAGKAAEGFIFATVFDRDDNRPVVKKFVEMFKKERGMEPAGVAASVYDTILVICEAIKRAGSTEPKAILKGLAETKNVEGVCGLIRGFDKDRNVIKPIQVQIIKDGRFRHYEKVEFEKAAK